MGTQPLKEDLETPISFTSIISGDWLFLPQHDDVTERRM